MLHVKNEFLWQMLNGLIPSQRVVGSNIDGKCQKVERVVEVTCFLLMTGLWVVAADEGLELGFSCHKLRSLLHER
jgi:hypothetical protein